jgi:hypothetical protein
MIGSLGLSKIGNMLGRLLGGEGGGFWGIGLSWIFANIYIYIYL